MNKTVSFKKSILKQVPQKVHQKFKPFFPYREKRKKWEWIATPTGILQKGHHCFLILCGSCQGSEGQGLLALPIPHCQYMHLTLTVLPSNDALLTQGSQSNLDFYTLRSSYDLREGLTAVFQNRQVPHLPPDQYPTRHMPVTPPASKPSWQA